MARVLSNEDGNLNSSSIIGTRRRLHKDIDLTFTARPSGDIYKKVDAAAVKQAVKNLVMTNHFEKPFLPRFGGNITGMLFELVNDPDIDEKIYNNIVESMEKYEPRAEILNIDVNPTVDENSIQVTITFQVINTEEVVTFTTVASRLR